MIKKVIALSGLPASGKGVIAEYFKEKGVPTVAMGDVVRYMYRKEVGGEMDSNSVGRFADRKRKSDGKEIWASETVRYIRDRYFDSFLVVIDGIRSPDEVRFFKKAFKGDFMLVWVDAPQVMRFRRALNRNRIDDIKSKMEFKERDLRELSWGLGEVKKLADLVIDNSGPESETIEKFLSNEKVKAFTKGAI